MSIGISIMLLALAVPAVHSEVASVISGDYVEARSNHVYTCGCLYSGESVTSGREAILAWNIQSGTFRGVQLGGVKVAVVLAADDSLSAGAKPVVTVFYFDSKTTADQRNAAAEFLRIQLGSFNGGKVVEHVAPVSFTREGDQTTVAVSDRLRLVIRRSRLPEDAHGGSSLWYAPMIPLSEAALGTSLNSQFQGTDLLRKWRIREPGITGYLGRFVFTPPIS